MATATTESIPLAAVRGVMLTHVVESPSSYVPGSLGRELTLTLGWGTVARLDLVPASCPDPDCDADDGHQGTITGDDIAPRISAAADGDDALERQCSFARDPSAAHRRRADRRMPPRRLLPSAELARRGRTVASPTSCRPWPRAEVPGRAVTHGDPASPCRLGRGPSRPRRLRSAYELLCARGHAPASRAAAYT